VDLDDLDLLETYLVQQRKQQERSTRHPANGTSATSHSGKRK
jgi:hypothetical protein